LEEDLVRRCTGRHNRNCFRTSYNPRNDIPTILQPVFFQHCQSHLRRVYPNRAPPSRIRQFYWLGHNLPELSQDRSIIKSDDSFNRRFVANPFRTLRRDSSHLLKLHGDYCGEPFSNFGTPYDQQQCDFASSSQRDRRHSANRCFRLFDTFLKYAITLFRANPHVNCIDWIQPSLTETIKFSLLAG
jgi:hypothetical protein